MDLKEEAYQDSPRDTDSLNEEEYDGLVTGYRHSVTSKKSKFIAKLIPILFLASVGLNIFQLVWIAVRRPQCVSLYAKLPEREKVINFKYATEYSSDEVSPEDKDALWASIDISEGYIALSHDESDALGLPRSETFPWDANKGMYISHGHHALHCTVLLHAFTYDAHRGKEPMVSYHHIEHCLDLLRQDIICNADDNLDFTAGHGDEFFTGDNQPRMCRDWEKLREFVKPRSSCYRTVNITRAGEDHGVEHQLDRYTYCPEGSPYKSVIDAWRYLNQPNHGNLAHDAEDAAADTEAVAKHNSEILEN